MLGPHPQQRMGSLEPARPVSLGMGSFIPPQLILGWICNLTVTMETLEFWYMRRSVCVCGGELFLFGKSPLNVSQDTWQLLPCQAT